MDVPAATNGGGGDSNGGLTEEELERQRMRPADVDADMREMSRRRRVDAILGSKSFKVCNAGGRWRRRAWVGGIRG